MSGVDRQMRQIGPGEEYAGTPVVTMGTFDGVHRGHQGLMARARELAATLGTDWLVVTFDPPPSEVLRGDAAPRQLTPIEEKLWWLERLRVPAVAVVPFTPELAAWPGERFLDEVVQERLHACAVIEGPNFTYGAGGRGNLDTLIRWGAGRGVRVERARPVSAEGALLSSSRIRAAVAAQDLAVVAASLGRPYSATGLVVPGDGRGRTIGVPTANLELAPKKLMPPAGVYAGWAWTAECRWPAVANFGWRPTFTGGDHVPRLEVHLLDAAPGLDLYGVRLAMSLAVAVRPERRFATVEALVAQIQQDMALVRELAVQERLPSPDGVFGRDAS